MKRTTPTPASGNTDNLIISKKLIKKIGIIPAIVLTFFVNEFKKNPSNDSIFFSNESIRNDIGIAVFSIRKAKTFLEGLGLIKVEKKGWPAKDYVVLNQKALQKLL